MTQSPHKTAGKHFILDFWDADKLRDASAIETAMREAADAAGAVLLDIHLHQFSNNDGITGVALLAESHISVHTWPEHGYAAFDVFMCGEAQASLAVEHLKREFKPERCTIKEIDRG